MDEKKEICDIVTSSHHSKYGSLKSKVDFHSIAVTSDRKTETGTEKTFRKTIVAYIVCISSMVLSCLSIASVQVLGGAIPEFELNAWRFGVQVFLISPVIIYRRCDLIVPKRKLLLLFAMFFVYNAFNVVYFTAAIYLAIGTVFGITNCTTIASNAILSVCIKQDRKMFLYLGAILAIIGILMMTQPPFMFPGNLLPPSPVTNFSSPCVDIVKEGTTVRDMEYMGYIFAVLSGLALCAIFHGMSKLVTEVNTFTFAFWNGLVGTAVSLIFMGILETPVMPASPICILLLLGHALGSSQISVILPWCLQYLSPTVCALVNSLQMVVLLTLQYTALKDIQPGHGNWVEILGAVACFIGIVVGPTWHMIKGNKTNNLASDIS